MPRRRWTPSARARGSTLRAPIWDSLPVSCVIGMRPYHDSPWGSSYTVRLLQRNSQLEAGNDRNSRGLRSRIRRPRAVAVPITDRGVSFDSAEHGAPLFNLEVPATGTAESAIRPDDVLEQRSPNSKRSPLERGFPFQTAVYLRGVAHGVAAISLVPHCMDHYTLFAHFRRRWASSALREIRPCRRSER